MVKLGHFHATFQIYSLELEEKNFNQMQFSAKVVKWNSHEDPGGRIQVPLGKWKYVYSSQKMIAMVMFVG